MPYAISSQALCEVFPHNCPYCSTAPASTTVRQPYSKMGLSRIPGHVKSQTWKVELPSCPDCARWFRYSRVAVFILGFLALLLPILIVIDTSVVPTLWCFSLAGWFVLLFWRRYRFGAFRIAYIGENEIVYAARSEAFASDFAAKNNLSYEQRALVMRLA